MRSTEEKEKMVSDLKKLRNKLPEKNYFGEDNWKSIDAQIAIIESNGDKTPEYFEAADDSVYNAASDVQEWLEGNLESDSIIDPDDIEDEVGNVEEKED